jgi:hypothetical protein
MATWNSPQQWSEWMAWLEAGLRGRSRWRLGPVMMGMLLARGRRTVTTWLRAVDVGDDFADYYYFLAVLGRKSGILATKLLICLLRHLPLPDRLLVAVDDTPTKRYGPQVQGAGIHRNPTSGPADQKFVYGHIWVTLALVVRHPWWGTIGLPLWARLYVRQKDVPKIPEKHQWKFQTKLELAAQLVEWLSVIVFSAGKTLWIVADGAYASRPFLEPLLWRGIVVVSRLRKNSALFDLPPKRPVGQNRRGRPRKYGEHRIHLAKRALQRRGWQTITCMLYGEVTTKTYKTFLATYRPVGGVIRVVLVREEKGWQAFFCTDPHASVQEILEAYADRGSIEQVFHDVKEVWGAGQQQVRTVWTNVATYCLNLWMHTLVELWAWHQPAWAISNRDDSPWDDPRRRPSHADRRKALRRMCLRQEYSTVRYRHRIPRKIRHFIKRLIQLAA